MEKKRRNSLKTALVFTGGGSQGAIEVGALKVLDKHITPDVMLGTSVGAINAALYAAGVSPLEIEEFWGHVDSRSVFPFNWQILYLLGSITSISHPYKLRRLIERTLPIKTFEECKIPLYINATELRTGKSVFFHSGSIIDAIMASSAVPPYYPPYSFNGVKYLDGALSNVIAIDEARKLKCDQIIAVSTYGQQQCTYKLWNVFQVASRVMNMTMLNKFHNELEIETRGLKHVVLISPKFPSYIHINDFRYTKDLIRYGEEEAKRMLPRIKR